MRKELTNKLLSYARNNESIESIFYVRNENYDSFTKVYTIVNDIIVGKLEEDLVNLFDDVILLNRTKEEISLDKESLSYTNINLYTLDNIKITESIIAADYGQDFINKLPNDIEFIYNKLGFERLDPNLNYRIEKPSEYEYTSTVRNFFAKAIETSLYINEKDELAASIKMDDLRKDLITMLNFYVEDKYSYTMDMGDDGQKLKKTLELDYKEDFLLSYHHEDFMDIYNSLFKACVLFRQLGLELSKKFSYPYPKEIDVKALRLLRNNYKKLESFLN